MYAAPACVFLDAKQVSDEAAASAPVRLSALARDMVFNADVTSKGSNHSRPSGFGVGSGAEQFPRARTGLSFPVTGRFKPTG
jgi:hypothetical protein